MPLNMDCDDDNNFDSDTENEKEILKVYENVKKFTNSKPKFDPTYMGVSDFGVLDENFDDGTSKEPFYDPNDVESIKKRIFWAAQNGQINVLKEILENPHAKGILESAYDEDGYTPLHRACYNGHPIIVKYLLDMGANPRAKTNDGWEPIHCASFWSHHESLYTLLNHNPLPEQCLSAEIFNEQNSSATNTPSEQTVQLSKSIPSLIMNGSTIPNDDKYLRDGFVDLKSQSIVNCRTNGGLTPLHLACQNNCSKETIEILMFHPLIDLSIKTPMGDTAYELAKRKCPCAAYLFESFEPSLNTL